MSYGTQAHIHSSLPVTMWCAEVDGEVRMYKTKSMARSFVNQRVRGRERSIKYAQAAGRQHMPQITGRVWESDPISWNEVH